MARLGKSDELQDPVLKFMQVMWELDHELQRASKRMDASIGLTGPQRLALLLIGQRPGLSAGQLARLLRLHPGTLTGVITRLERAGFIVREWAAEDGRRMRLMLTDKGRGANRRRTGTVEAAVRRTLGALPLADRDAAGRVLSALTSQLRRDRTPSSVARASRGTRSALALQPHH